MPARGDVLRLDVEKAAAGGRMLARHDGQVVLVSGAIPGERIAARVERVQGGVIFAGIDAVDVASPDRREAGADPACGGADYAHIAYERQVSLKRDVLRDAFGRIGKLPLDENLPTHTSPERGYRMRARLHVQGSQIGFYREGSRELCDPAATGQLLDSTILALAGLSRTLSQSGLTSALSVDLAENAPASERALWIDLRLAPDGQDRWDSLLAADATSVAVAVDGHLIVHRGEPVVHDEITIAPASGDPVTLRLQRHAGAFFQGNRFLLQTLVDRVLAHVPEGPVIDLYAGGGLFGLACAAAGRGPVELVESDRLAVHDLRANASARGGTARVRAMSVEEYLSGSPALAGRTLLLDPPRTGLSRDAGTKLAGSDATRIVYVSCDPATLARDARRLVDADYRLSAVEVFDLFPTTAHVETLAVFDRDAPAR